MSEPNQWRPSGSIPGKFEYGQIGYPVKQGVYPSELCDVANALEAKLEAAGKVMTALEAALKAGEQADGALYGGRRARRRFDISGGWRRDWYGVVLTADAALAAACEAGLSATPQNAQGDA